MSDFLDEVEREFEDVHKQADAELWFWKHARKLLTFARERNDRVIELEHLGDEFIRETPIDLGKEGPRY